jgi:hypothetical protein
VRCDSREGCAGTAALGWGGLLEIERAEVGSAGRGGRRRRSEVC